MKDKSKKKYLMLIEALKRPKEENEALLALCELSYAEGKLDGINEFHESLKKNEQN